MATTMTVELRRRPQVQRICFRSWRIPSQLPSQDSYASYVGHYPMLAYFAVAENESIGRERYNFMQEDLNYLWKLGAGSIVGAAAIKYGSLLFPEITGPNLLEAMIIISSPVLVAVLLLVKQSRLEQ